MLAPQAPQNEKARLLALQDLHVLDTAAEQRFDRFTKLAAKLFDVHICLVSLVDANRLWFKSKQGLSASEMSRDTSFCGYSILGDETFVVENALLDERFADNPLVTGEPNIRFYAGRPLTIGDGFKMGTLCLIDSKPQKIM